MEEDIQETWKKIGTVIGITGVVAATTIAPGIIVALVPFFERHTRLSKQDIYRRLQYARRKKWFSVSIRDDGVFLKLTKRGQRMWLRAELDQPLDMKKWDGKWRIAIFDIPEKNKLNRESLRRTLANLKFVQLQESVWVTPYPCREEIEVMKQLYEIGDNLRLITATDFDGHDDLKEQFGLAHGDVRVA